MPLPYYPGAWRIMRCDFNTGFKEPEMVKRRPVITISKSRSDNAPLCTVIPLSNTPPEVVRDYHYILPQDQLPHALRNGEEEWVKADMLTTVAFFRLTMLWHGRDQHGQRIYQTSPIALEHQIEISSRIEDYLSLKFLEK